MKGPKIIFSDVLNPEEPFSYKPFLDTLLEKMKFPFKLYGVLPLQIIYQDAKEIDLMLGDVHLTEADLREAMQIMKEMNQKYLTTITFCVYQSTQYPGQLLLNIRGPKAPVNIKQNISFDPETQNSVSLSN